MKVTVTAKLKLHPAAQQFQALRKTQLAYRDGLNYVSRYALLQRYAESRWSLDTSPAL